MKIYTKTGDTGETSLLGGGRVTKDCITMQVVGELDELNAALGLVITQCLASNLSIGELRELILQTQKNLFKVGAEVASFQGVMADKIDKIGELEIVTLEKNIDKMSGQMPELKNFILPGGSEIAARLHLARAICRRAERALVAFGGEQKLRSEVYQYLNRLSDWLFTAARYINFELKERDNIIID